MKSISLYVSLYLLVAICCLARQPAPDHSQKLLNSALDLARSEQVTEACVFYIPEEAARAIPISPSAMEHSYWGSFRIRWFKFTGFRKKLIAALNKASLAPRDDLSGDYRWACILYDSQGKRLTSIYLTAGTNAQIDELPVTANRELVDCFRQEFRGLTEIWGGFGDLTK